jgi:hypothetical protein
VSAEIVKASGCTNEREMRKEQEIFDELATLCMSPGYVHAIAYLCLRDNIVRYGDEMTAEDMPNGGRCFASSKTRRSCRRSRSEAYKKEDRAERSVSMRKWREVQEVLSEIEFSAFQVFVPLHHDDVSYRIN